MAFAFHLVCVSVHTPLHIWAYVLRKPTAFYMIRFHVFRFNEAYYALSMYEGVYTRTWRSVIVTVCVCVRVCVCMCVPRHTHTYIYIDCRCSGSAPTGALANLIGYPQQRCV